MRSRHDPHRGQAMARERQHTRQSSGWQDRCIPAALVLGFGLMGLALYQTPSARDTKRSGYRSGPRWLSPSSTNSCVSLICSSTRTRFGSGGRDKVGSRSLPKPENGRDEQPKLTSSDVNKITLGEAGDQGECAQSGALTGIVVVMGDRTGCFSSRLRPACCQAGTGRPG